jgi:GAF domain-containing protein
MPKMLSSWKEIGQYLGKGVRAVQCWDREAGLPVRRLAAASPRAVLNPQLQSRRKHFRNEMNKQIEVTEELSVEDVLRLINRTIPCFRSREELLQEICAIAIDRCGFDLAWVGWIDEATGRLDPVAVWSTRAALLDANGIGADYPLAGRGPAEIAIWSDRTYICNDYLDHSETFRWRDRNLADGFRTSASFPIRESGKVVGAINLHSRIASFFNSRVVQLLEEAVADLSLALGNLQRRKDREADQRH